MKLKDLRQKKKASQQDVANYLGISRQAYGHYETETREPDFETLLKLSEYFDVTVDYILRGTEKMPTQEGEREIGFDDFTYAMQNETKELTESDKDVLLTMARQLNNARKKRDGENS